MFDIFVTVNISTRFMSQVCCCFCLFYIEFLFVEDLNVMIEFCSLEDSD